MEVTLITIHHTINPPKNNPTIISTKVIRRKQHTICVNGLFEFFLNSKHESYTHILKLCEKPYIATVIRNSTNNIKIEHISDIVVHSKIVVLVSKSSLLRLSTS